METLAEDEARDWLARPEPKGDPVPAAIVAAAEAPAVALPDTLVDFIAWRLGDDAPEAEWLTPRIAPSGAAGAGLMVLTDMPEAEDRDSLMRGPEGRLLDAMLAAIGESRDSVHLASIAVARPLTGQLSAQDEARLGPLARHHVALVAPERLLLLGLSANRVFDTTNGSGFGNTEGAINHFVRNKVVVPIDHPRTLLRWPAKKAEAWNQLLRLRRGTSQ